MGTLQQQAKGNSKAQIVLEVKASTMVRMMISSLFSVH